MDAGVDQAYCDEDVFLLVEDFSLFKYTNRATWHFAHLSLPLIQEPNLKVLHPANADFVLGTKLKLERIGCRR